MAACPSGQYTFAAPTGTSDRVCHSVLECNAATEYETAAPTQSSNRACAACPAGHSCDGSATATPCAAGTYAALGAGSCTAWRDCAVGEGLANEGTSATDRTCAACAAGYTFSASSDGLACASVRVCTAIEYEIAAPTVSLNRACGS